MNEELKYQAEETSPNRFKAIAWIVGVVLVVAIIAFVAYLVMQKAGQINGDINQVAEICTSNEDCPLPCRPCKISTTFCDTDSGKCVQCLSDTDCLTGYKCEQEKCLLENAANVGSRR